jgi:hypothetical protein
MKPPKLLAAEARAAEARQRLMGTVGEIQERLQPRNVLSEVGETVSNTSRKALATTVKTAKRKPLIAIGAAALAVAILGRHRIRRLIAPNTPTGHAKD